MAKTVSTIILGMLVIGLFAGCSTAPPESSRQAATAAYSGAPALDDEIQPQQEPPSATGNAQSYVVFGKRYQVMLTSEGYRQRGVASWYGPGFHGRKTSSGGVYNMYGVSAAHKHLPIPTYARVTHLGNGRSIVVRIDDRGPFVGDRLVDLSYGAAAKLGMIESGTAEVEIETLPPYQSLPGMDPGTALAGRDRSTAESAWESVVAGGTPQVATGGVRKPAGAGTRVASREPAPAAWAAVASGDAVDESPQTPTATAEVAATGAPIGGTIEPIMTRSTATSGTSARSSRRPLRNYASTPATVPAEPVATAPALADATPVAAGTSSADAWQAVTNSEPAATGGASVEAAAPVVAAAATADSAPAASDSASSRDAWRSVGGTGTSTAASRPHTNTAVSNGGELALISKPEWPVGGTSTSAAAPPRAYMPAPAEVPAPVAPKVSYQTPATAEPDEADAESPPAAEPRRPVPMTPRTGSRRVAVAAPPETAAEPPPAPVTRSQPAVVKPEPVRKPAYAPTVATKATAPAPVAVTTTKAPESKQDKRVVERTATGSDVKAGKTAVAKQSDDKPADEKSAAKYDTKVAKADDKASKANDKLAKADDKAGKANDKLAKADDKLAKANDKLAKADDKLAKADDKAGKANDKLTKADDKAAQSKTVVAVAGRDDGKTGGKPAERSGKGADTLQTAKVDNKATKQTVASNTNRGDAKDAKAGNNVFVQAGAFSERENAEALRKRLVRMFGNAVRIESSDNHLHKVRVGPLANSADAGVVKVRLANLGIGASHVVVD